MIDYHIHTERSGDGQGSILDACEVAISKGLQEICFTEHVDFEPTDLCFDYFDYKLYRSQFEEAQEVYSDKLKIRFGVEIDFQEKFRSRVEDFFDGKEFDYVIGSAHYVNGVILEDHDKYFPGKTQDEAYIPYLENVLATVETGLFDTLGHMDLCKRYGVRYFGDFNPELYADKVAAILNTVINQGMTLEVNTSGLRQSPKDTYPSAYIISQYKALGGRRITVGSDAHYPEDIGAGIKQTLDTLLNIGIDYVDSYRKRERTQKPIPRSI